MYSLDRSVFKYVAPEATNRRLVPFERHRLDLIGRPAAAVTGPLTPASHGAHGCATGGDGRAGTMAVDAVELRRVACARTKTRPGARPTERLPFRQLLQISVYWLGINAIMGGVGIVIQDGSRDRRPGRPGGRLHALPGLLVDARGASLVQPTVGMISDYTDQPLGPPQAVHRHRGDARRRLPHRARDVATYVSLVAFLVLLQFSSNFAQGPFQGYVPDLVPPAAGRARERAGRA